MNALTIKQRENCRILATEILPGVPDSAFNMSTWARPARNECGTIGCAMGWAAMSGRIDGLGWCAPDGGFSGWAKDLSELTDFHCINPAIRHRRQWKVAGWGEAAVEMFGRDAWQQVFTHGFLTKSEVIARLLKLAGGKTVALVGADGGA